MEAKEIVGEGLSSQPAPPIMTESTQQASFSSLQEAIVIIKQTQQQREETLQLLQQLRAEMARKAPSNAELGKQLSQMAVDLNNAGTEINRLEGCWCAAEERSSKLAKNVQELHIELQEAQQRGTTLQQRNAWLEKQRSELCAANLSNQQAIRQLTLRSDGESTLLKEFDGMKQAFADLANQLKKSTKQGQVGQECIQQRERIAFLQKIEDELNQRLTRLTMEKEHQQEQLRKRVDQVNKLTRQLEEKTGEELILAHQLKARCEQNAHLEERVRDLQNNVDEGRERETKLLKTAQAAKMEVELAQVELQALRKERSDIQTQERTDNQSQIAQLQAEIDSLREKSSKSNAIKSPMKEPEVSKVMEKRQLPAEPPATIKYFVGSTCLTKPEAERYLLNLIAFPVQNVTLIQKDFTEKNHSRLLRYCSSELKHPLLLLSSGQQTIGWYCSRKQATIFYLGSKQWMYKLPNTTISTTSTGDMIFSEGKLKLSLKNSMVEMHVFTDYPFRFNVSELYEVTLQQSC